LTKRGSIFAATVVPRIVNIGDLHYNPKERRILVVEMPKLLEGKWPELRRAKASANTGWAYFGDLVKTMHSVLGEEKTAEILSVFMAGNAKKYVKAGMEGFDIQGNDAWALASYFKLATGDVIGYNAELVQESPKRVLYRLYPPCIWFPELDIPPSFCRAMGAFEKVAAEIVNPKIKIISGKLMTAGDSYCEIIFEED